MTTNKEELVKAIEEHKVKDFILETITKAGRFDAYGFELSKNTHNEYQIIQTTSNQYHHNDAVIVEGSLEYCANVLTHKLNSLIHIELNVE